MMDHLSVLSEDDVIVILLPDSGSLYLSKTYSDRWMRDHGFVETGNDLTVLDILRRRKKENRLVTVDASDSLGDAVTRMTEYSISQMPVTDGEEVVGNLTERSEERRGGRGG